MGGATPAKTRRTATTCGPPGLSASTSSECSPRWRISTLPEKVAPETESFSSSTAPPGRVTKRRGNVSPAGSRPDTSTEPPGSTRPGMRLRSVVWSAVSAHTTAPTPVTSAAAAPTRLKRHDRGKSSPTARSAFEGGLTVAMPATGDGSTDSSEA